jgi:hypothetical protein
MVIQQDTLNPKNREDSMIFRFTPMIWYDVREQSHKTVFGIKPEPSADSPIKYRCESADRRDPMYIDNRHYHQVLDLQGKPITWEKLPEYINFLLENNFQLFPLSKAEFPRPNQSFYIQSVG